MVEGKKTNKTRVIYLCARSLAFICLSCGTFAGLCGKVGMECFPPFFPFFTHTLLFICLVLLGVVGLLLLLL